jgi:hypothetical protein
MIILKAVAVTVFLHYNSITYFYRQKKQTNLACFSKNLFKTGLLTCLKQFFGCLLHRHWPFVLLQYILYDVLPY